MERSVTSRYHGSIISVNKPNDEGNGKENGKK